ncbi:MAG: pirin family protein [Chitinophagaceae bacterium]|nr:pirin family protein [Chitinophagaceae bacterium]
MTDRSKGKIFLADERGLNETEWFRSLNTFNFGKYANPYKQPFGDIYVVNDDSLDAGRSLQLTIEEFSYVVLLPVMGAIASKDPSGNEHLIAAGQIEILTADKEETIEISNPFDEGLVNFLQIWIKADIIRSTKGSYLQTYNVNKCPDTLVKISPASIGTSALPFSIAIGKFNGRSETTYHLKKKNAGLFVFVIEGVFEVQGRLLHVRDGLALWDIEEAEMEALSNNAIILAIELPLD